MMARSVAVVLLGVVLGSCASLGAELPIPRPRDFVLPASCQLTDPDSRAYGTSWTVTCTSDAAAAVGTALSAAGWRACTSDPTVARFRKDDLVTEISPKRALRARLVQISRGDECSP